MKSPPEKQLERQQIRRAFNRAAAVYDDSAVLQKEVGERLLERLDLLKMQPQRILDLGTGTGEALLPLLGKYPEAQLFAVDIAEGMLQQARRKLSWWQRFRNRVGFVSAEAEHLPLADASMDMIISGLTLQWCDDLDVVFQEFERILAPDGVILFTTFGPDTLTELRYAWQQVDQESHIHTFIDMHDIGDALLRARLAEPVMDMEVITVNYQDAWQIMRDLKNIGAHNASLQRPRYLTGKQRFRQVIEAYETFRSEGKLPVTYEIVYGHAWAAGNTAQSSIKVEITPMHSSHYPGENK